MERNEKRDESKDRNMRTGNMAQLVPEKYEDDMVPDTDYTHNNPYKTPPNNLTNKRKDFPKTNR